MKPSYIKLNIIGSRRSVGMLALSICVISLHYACATLKTKALLKSKSISEFVKEQDSVGISQTQVQEKINFYYSDSAKNTSLVTINPVGPFSYSPEKGFTGNASSILIAGNSAQWQGINGIKESNLTTEQISKTDGSEKKTQSSNQKEIQTKKKITGKWVGWVLAVMAILVISWVQLKK